MNLSKEQEYAIAFKVLDELKSTPTNMGTPFEKVYNCFLNKITDDMYLELTPEDTVKDL
jgi:hypothetical protein